MFSSILSLSYLYFCLLISQRWLSVVLSLSLYFCLNLYFCLFLSLLYLSVVLSLTFSNRSLLSKSHSPVLFTFYLSNFALFIRLWFLSFKYCLYPSLSLHNLFLSPSLSRHLISVSLSSLNFSLFLFLLHLPFALYLSLSKNVSLFLPFYYQSLSFPPICQSILISELCF